MRYITIISFLALFTGTVFGQSDQKAVAILDKLSSEAVMAPSVSMELVIVSDDKAMGSSDTLKGKLILKGESYRLTLPGNDIWCNGKVVWSYASDFNEVTITDPVYDSGSMLTTPSAIYTMYKKGYKVRLLNETSSLSVIDLYPTDIKTDLLRIRLEIVSAGNRIKSIEYANKSGVTITIDIKNYSLGFTPPAGYFSFDTSKYKGIEVIDMR